MPWIVAEVEGAWVMVGEWGVGADPLPASSGLAVTSTGARGVGWGVRVQPEARGVAGAGTVCTGRCDGGSGVGVGRR